MVNITQYILFLAASYINNLIYKVINKIISSYDPKVDTNFGA